MPGSILGNSVVRREDPDLLLGRATFVDNLQIDGLLHLAFVRSSVAHALIAGIDTSEAAGMPGVVGVFVAADLDLPAGHGLFVLNEACARPPLAVDKVRFVGEAVAAVVAETKAAAVDAAELVVVDYEPLEAVVDPEDALVPGAPVQFDEIGTNRVAGMRDPEELDPLAGADVVVRARIVNQRIAVVPLEGNAIAAVPRRDGDGREHDLTVYISTQMPHLFHKGLAGIFDLAPDDLRVVAPHVGGAFGGKVGVGAEHAVAVAVARRLDRPVKWAETRSENLVAMPHGRGQVQYVELGCRSDGTIVGLRCRVIADAGAYGGFGGGLAMGSTRSMAQGVYRIPAIAFDVAVAVTNTTPMGAYRGAGRPEAAAMLERIMDMAAAELGIDPLDLRRRNFLQPDEFPLTTLTGAKYDNGEYDKALTKAAELAGYEGLRAEQAQRRERNDRWQLGIGIGSYVEVTAGGSANEYGSVAVDTDGWATVSVGTSAHGQGHATSFAMIVSDRLGIPIERIRFVQSDTALVPRGGGTGGSRSLQVGGDAVSGATELVLERGRALAADLLEAAVDDVVVTEDGRLGVAGVPTSGLAWAELARKAESDGDPLAAIFDFTQAGATYPFGAHVSVMEVDTETGQVRPLRHVAVDDCGRILNPLLVTGQQHGGIAQGIAQVLFEEVVHDEAGNPLTSTLADYSIPSAAEFPSFEAANTETPTHMNPLGAKGIGESGTIGALASAHNAVVDALRPLGVRHVDMPCTPERVWAAIEAARAGRGDPWREPPDVFEGLKVRRPRPPKEAEAAAEVDV